MNFIADSIAGIINVSPRRSRDICVEERAEENVLTTSFSMSSISFVPVAAKATQSTMLARSAGQRFRFRQTWAACSHKHIGPASCSSSRQALTTIGGMSNSPFCHRNAESRNHALAQRYAKRTPLMHTRNCQATIPIIPMDNREWDNLLVPWVDIDDKPIPVDVSQYSLQNVASERAVHEDDDRLLRKDELSRAPTNHLGPCLGDQKIVSGNFAECGCEFYPDDSLKAVFSSEDQGPPFSAAKVNERELVRLNRKTRHGVRKDHDGNRGVCHSAHPVLAWDPKVPQFDRIGGSHTSRLIEVIA